MWRAATLSSGSILLAAFLAATSIARADDIETAAPASADAEPIPWLLGDWGGMRTRLKNRGIDFQFGYTNEFAYNATGGIKKTATYADQYTAGVTLDLDKLISVPAAQFQITYTERTGRNLSDDAELGTLQQVQEVFGRSGFRVCL